MTRKKNPEGIGFVEIGILGVVGYFLYQHFFRPSSTVGGGSIQQTMTPAAAEAAIRHYVAVGIVRDANQNGTGLTPEAFEAITDNIAYLRSAGYSDATIKGLLGGTAPWFNL